MNKKDALYYLADKLKNTSWCIFHGEEGLPYEITSDVDVMLSQQAKEEFLKVITGHKLKLVQNLQHEESCNYFVFAIPTEGGWEFLLFDTATDYRRNGRIIYKAEDVLKNLRYSADKLPLPSPSIAFGYYLVKKIAKKNISEAQCVYLSYLWQKDPQGCFAEAQKFFPLDSVRLITQSAENQNWQPVQEQINQMRQSLLTKLAYTNPMDVAIYWRDEIKRIIRRITHPTGVWVALMGLDGSGKSSVLEKVQEGLAPIGRNTARYHFRPGMGLQKNFNPPITNPHGEKARGIIPSILKIFYYFADYCFGFWVSIWPQLVHSTLILFDRYYYDILVDPKRYRYGGPQWLVQIVGHLIPQPDLFIYLDLPAEVARARKAEIPLEIAKDLRQKYLMLAASQTNAHVVNASNSIDEVTREVENIILDYMEQKTTRMVL